MKSRLNKYIVTIVMLGICIAFLTGCDTNLPESETSKHMGDLMPGQPAILGTGTPEEIRRTAIADARADIAASRPRIAITGGIASWPVGVPEKYLKLVEQYPKIPLPCGCTSSWLQQAGIYAEAYNKEILPYLLSQNKVHH